MNTKQTPEQDAMSAMLGYADYLDSSRYDRDYRNYRPSHSAARQTIIKAFQDRAELLAALESIANNRFTEHDHESKANEMRLIASDAISKAKAKS